MDNQKIRVAITHGDTNGIGYELIFKTFAEPQMLELCTPIIYGSPKVAAYHRKALDMQANFSIINDAHDAQDGRINLLACIENEVKVDLGEPTHESGLAALKALDRAMTDFRNGLFDVLVSCPIYNETMRDEDYKFYNLKDYLEMSVGDGCKAANIFINDSLRIVSATNGLGLKDVAQGITTEVLEEKINVMVNCLRRDFRLSSPRVAVLALNPDNGAEEQEIIAPAVEHVAEKYVGVFGPYTAKNLFSTGHYGEFDAILAMYDDQALIPFETLTGVEGFKYVGGLPLVCTAPAQGPCFHIAGMGQADESVFRKSLFAAIDIFRNRREYDEPYADPLKKLYHERRDESEKVRFSIPKKREAPFKEKPQE